MNEQQQARVFPAIEVCYGPECSDCGGRELAGALLAKGIPVVEGDCRDQCPNAPLVLIDGRMIDCATLEKVEARLKALQG